MERRIAERVDDWDARPFSGGFEALRSLSDSEFTGAVEAGSVWLFMLNGRVIGVFGGSIDDIEGAEGTVYRAPHPSLPLLYTMQQQAGDARAKYYTNDTPISEVDQTLSSGSFTGYIELSENVLSGDYYQVYYGGRSLSAAFVGNSDNLLTDEEAFERADDEVGIYKVYEVDIEITDIPGGDSDDGIPGHAGTPSDQETATDQPRTSGAGSAQQSSAPSDGTEPGSTQDRPRNSPQSDPSRTDRSQPSQGAAPRQNRTKETETDAVNGRAEPTDTRAGDTPPDRRGSRTTQQASGTDEVDERQETEQPTGRDRSENRRNRPGRSGGNIDEQPQNRSDRGSDDSRVSNRTDEAPPRTDDRTPTEAGAGHTEAPPGDRADTPPNHTATDQSTTEGRTRQQPTAESGTDAASSEVSTPSRTGPDPVDAEEAWRDAEHIPSLDPERTARPDETDDDPPTTPQSTSSGTERTTAPADAVEAPPADDRSTPNGQAGDSGEPFDAEVLEREDRIDRLQQRVSNLEADNTDLREERDELARTVDRLRDENSDLKSEIDHLEDELEALETELERAEAGGSDDDPEEQSQQPIAAAEALSGTDLFVRYASKSAATLDDVHAGDATPEEVNDNLRLEHHTRFDSATATVDGEPYESFLQRSLEYRFVEWFVTQLPYEIRDTGHTDALKDLFDAFPNVDRAELDAEVSLQYEQDGEEHREQATFDVVIRDRMGNPLVVANMNDSRDPASEPMMVDLKEAADKVKESSDSLGAAFLVTKSFFAPGALETASEATAGGFLSRDSRESFVKLSRKRGYHLCLVEARGDDFHLNVPEL